MADATGTKYDVEIEDLGAAKKRLRITVPAATIDAKIQESMGSLLTQTQLPGFRKGRAPKSLVERRFGETIRRETRNQVIADGYASAIEEHQIKPVGEPEPTDKIDELEIVLGQPLTFTVEVEVVPEFDLPDLAGIELKKPVTEVTDDLVDLEIMRQCTQLGEISQITEGFEEGDRVVGPGQATKDGDEEPFFSHDAIDIIVPSQEDGGRGQVLGLLIDGLAGMVESKKVGDTITVKTVGPDSHELEHVRGQKLTIELTIREGHRIIPVPVEAVLTRFGLESEEVLREQIKLALEQRRDEEQRAAMRDQVYDYLLGAVEFELPQKLSEGQAGRLLERQRLEMMYRGGLSVDDVERRLAEIRAETEAESRRRLKLSFLLHKLAQHFDVEVTDQEINGRIAAIAAQRGMRPEVLRAEMIQSGAVSQIATQIREHKAADRVVADAKTVDISAEEWNALIAEQRGGASKKTTRKKSTTKKKKKKKTATASE